MDLHALAQIIKRRDNNRYQCLFFTVTYMNNKVVCLGLTLNVLPFTQFLKNLYLFNK